MMHHGVTSPCVGFEVHWRSTRAALALQLGLLRLDEGLHEAAPAGDQTLHDDDVTMS